MQLVLQVPFEITINTIPVTSLLPTLSKRRHAMEQSLYKHLVKSVRSDTSKLSGAGLSASFGDRVAAFDAKLKGLFPRLFSSDCKLFSACVAFCVTRCVCVVMIRYHSGESPRGWHFDGAARIE